MIAQDYADKSWLRRRRWGRMLSRGATGLLVVTLMLAGGGGFAIILFALEKTR